MSITSNRHFSRRLSLRESPEDAVECEKLLAEAEMFSLVPKHLRLFLAQQMALRVLGKNETFIRQGESTDRFFLLESGDIRRTRLEDGKAHTVEFAIKAKSINSMRVISGEKAFSSVKCTSDSCRVYEMMRSDFLEALAQKPEISLSIAEGLCSELRKGSKKYATPLLEQQSQDVNIPSVAIAAGIESYYRSALNAKLNRHLTGVKADLFPNMHIQVPTRIAYITGFKGLRSYLDHHVQPESYEYPTAVRLATAVSPGIIMTPISSLLEASNAGHMNSESMLTRWMRGIVPRTGREIIFGVGLNQLSDYFEERLQPYFGDPFDQKQNLMANAAGSLVAGVVSGYLSHVPHNLSTLKLLEPNLSYSNLYKAFVDKSVPPMVESMVSTWSPTPRSIARTTLATLFPRGLTIRTTQIVGSFIILNGTINFLQHREHQKIERAVGGSHVGTLKA